MFKNIKDNKTHFDHISEFDFKNTKNLATFINVDHIYILYIHIGFFIECRSTSRATFEIPER